MSAECHSCPDPEVEGSEGMPEGECEASERPCGHHCNCSWENDHCHWCGAEFGEELSVSEVVD